jgi:hypothetical protein
LDYESVRTALGLPEYDVVVAVKMDIGSESSDSVAVGIRSPCFDAGLAYVGTKVQLTYGSCDGNGNTVNLHGKPVHWIGPVPNGTFLAYTGPGVDMSRATLASLQRMTEEAAE